MVVAGDTPLGSGEKVSAPNQRYLLEIGVVTDLEVMLVEQSFLRRTTRCPMPS
jgi:hypothetical protein